MKPVVELLRTMRRFGVVVLVAAFVCMAAAPSQADDSRESLTVLMAFALVDYDQSSELFYHRSGYHEMNPIMGKYPARADMAVFGIVGISAVYLSQKLLPKPWAQVVMDSVLASEQFNIQEIARIMQGEKRHIQGVPILLSFRF